MEEQGIRVQLARIEGKQDVTNERLETANRINEERHEGVRSHLLTIDSRLNSHGERITGIEKREIGKEGERKGFLTSGKVLMMMIGAVPVAVIAGLLKAFGG